MNRTLLVILLATGFVILLCLGTAGFVAYRVVSHLDFDSAFAPPPPGIAKGAGFLNRSVRLSDPSLGSVTGLIRDPVPGAELGVAGTAGAVLLEAGGAVQSRIPFDHSGSHVEFLDVEGDGTWEFLNRGGVGWSDASLLDAAGRTLWTTSRHQGVDDMAAGDLDGDGTADFVVGHNGNGGIRRLDQTGRETWMQSDGNVWHVELIDTDGDGKPEIVHTNAAGQVKVRDARGTVLHQTASPASYVSAFSQVRWPTATDKTQLLSADEGRLWLMDPTDASKAAPLDAPSCHVLGHARGARVRLKSGEPEYLAVLVDYGLRGYSLLYVYEPGGGLVYQETIADSVRSLLAVPNGDGDAEDLLIGGTGTVWSYRAAAQKPGAEEPAP